MKTSIHFTLNPLLKTGNESQTSLMEQLPLPIQLPSASWLKPTGHRGLELHLNEPSVFTHSKPGPQLWLRCTHSLISEEEDE